MSSLGLYYSLNRRVFSRDKNILALSNRHGVKKFYEKRQTIEVVKPNGSRKKVQIVVQAIECPYCKNRFVTLLELEGHVNETHQSYLKPIYKCQYCDFCTLEKRQLESHLQQKHEESLDISKYVMTILQESLDSHLVEKNRLEIEKIPAKHEQRDINFNVTECNNFEVEKRLPSACQELSKPLKKIEEDKDDDFHGFYRFDCPHCDFIGFNQIEIGQHVIGNHAKLQVERNAQTRKN